MKKITILLIVFMVISVGFLSGCNEQVEAEAPIINSFTATPSVIAIGNTSVLNWSVDGATNISIDNEIGFVPLNGPYTITPTQNTTYTLTASNSYGSSNTSVTVYVNEQSSEEGEAPIINSFTATPSVIVLGNTSVLNWSIKRATDVNINNEIGQVPLNGPYTIIPTKNTTYILTASNSYGSSNASVTVYVNEQTSEEGEAPIINSFTATPSVIVLGNNSLLKWSVIGAISVSINNGIGNVVISGPYIVMPTKNTTYILTASNSYGSSNESVTVYVNEQASEEGKAPIINFFKATPYIVNYGNSTILEWSVTGATNVSINNGIGNKPSIGSLTFIPPYETKKYILTASNEYGTTYASFWLEVTR